MDELTPAEQIVAEQTAILHNLRLYYRDLYRADLYPLDPDAYFDRRLDRETYRAPKDRSEKLAAKEAGITQLLKLQALFSKSAQDELNDRKAKAEGIQAKLAEEHARTVEEDRALFLRQQELYNQNVLEQQHNYIAGEPVIVMAYFEDVSLSDDFTLEFAEQPLSYDSCAHVTNYAPDKKELCIRYRVPNVEEICTIDSFSYNEKEWMVEPKELPEKNAYRVRTSVLHAIMVRSAALVFYSDPYHLVKTLTITGYLDYFDPAYGTNQTVDVIQATVGEEEFLKVNLERARLEDLFARLFASKVAQGLYKKRPYEFKPLA